MLRYICGYLTYKEIAHFSNLHRSHHALQLYKYSWMNCLEQVMAINGDSFTVVRKMYQKEENLRNKCESIFEEIWFPEINKKIKKRDRTFEIGDFGKCEEIFLDFHFWSQKEEILRIQKKVTV